MKHTDYLYQITNPVPAARLKMFPDGNIVQAWADSPGLYSKAFGTNDDIHRFTAGHTGLDITAYHRAPVVAAHDGTVKAVKTDPKSLGGLCLWIDSPWLDFNHTNDSYITTGYGHLDQIIVAPGERVTKGQLIGYMGNTGFVVSGGTPYWGNAPAGKGTHLHFSLYEYVRKDGAFQPRFNNLMQNTTDPLPYLTRDTTGLQNALRNMLAFILNRRGF